jgi:hypothetical protein
MVKMRKARESKNLYGTVLKKIAENNRFSDR